MKTDQDSILALLILHLSSMDLGDPRPLVQIASDTGLDSRTVKKYLKYVHLCQSFVPTIRFSLYEPEITTVRTSSLAQYVTQYVAPRERLLLKLLLKVFNRKLSAQSYVPVESLLLDHDELRELKQLDTELFTTDPESNLGLTAAGVAQAWKSMARFTSFRDRVLRDFMNDNAYLEDIRDLRATVTQAPRLAQRRRRLLLGRVRERR